MKGIKPLLFFIMTASLNPSLRADITGKVTLEGAPPEHESDRHVSCEGMRRLHPDPVTEETVIVGDKGELKNVVVSIKVDEDKELPGDVPKTPAVLDQKACMYEPHVLAMMVGQDLIVKNSDPFLHNVHTQSAINTQINSGMPQHQCWRKGGPATQGC